MPENITEFRGDFQDVLVISELRGAYPNVPISADVDYAALIAGDPEPVFVTLPIGKANVKSGNNRYYDEAFVTELMRQTLANKPIGLMGHLSEAERATAFPKESLHWVGAVRDGDLIWGKAYLIGEARERVRRYKASGKSIATSIDAHATGQWDESLKAYRMDAASLRLNQIDLAPADRAGIADLARVPMLTTEIEAPQVEVQPEKENKMSDKLTILQEMTVEDARLLPKVVRDAVLADVPTPPQVAMVQELCTALGVEESQLKTTITEMQRVQEQQRKDAIKSRITELAADPDKGVKVESVRGLVVELVGARQPATVQEAETAYQQVIEMAAVKAALAAQVQNTMGPRQRTVVQRQGSNERKYFDIPQEAN
jgi:hypothetical protein